MRTSPRGHDNNVNAIVVYGVGIFYYFYSYSYYFVFLCYKETSKSTVAIG